MVAGAGCLAVAQRCLLYPRLSWRRALRLVVPSAGLTLNRQPCGDAVAITSVRHSCLLPHLNIPRPSSPCPAARRALGLAIAQGIGAVDAPGGSRWAPLEGRTTYERLRLSDCVKTDPFSGASAGPLLQRSALAGLL